MTHTRFSAMIAALALSVAAGCGPSADVAYVDAGATYSLKAAGQRVKQVQANDLQNRPVRDAEQLRHTALVSLRSRGGDASQLADVITEEFGPDVRTVPFYAESAQVDGTPCWILVEAWGEADGTLSKRRLWVLKRETSEILLSTAAE